MENLESAFNEKDAVLIEKLRELTDYELCRIYNPNNSELKVIVIGDEHKPEFNVLENLVSKEDIILTDKNENIEPELKKYENKAKVVKFCGVTSEKMIELMEKYDSFKLLTIEKSRYIAMVTADTSDVNKGRIFERVHYYNILIPFEVEGKTVYNPDKGLLKNLEDEKVPYALLMPKDIKTEDKEDYSKALEKLKTSLDGKD